MNIERQIINFISNTAVESLICEVKTTPKPGLVDMNNSGAHEDMDIKTFFLSAEVLTPFFNEFTLAGFNNCQRSPMELFHVIRAIGLKAEAEMFKATKGINTHKGLIFSLGILCATVGYLYAKGMSITKESIQLLCSQMLIELEEDFVGINYDNAKTHGEKIFAMYGIKGIRGEALSGFESVYSTALPALRSMLNKGFSLNDSGVFALINLIARVDDTNIIARSDFKTLRETQKTISGYLENVFPIKNTSFIEYAAKLDDQFIDMNISPGGCADLLAITYYIHFIETNMPTITKDFEMDVYGINNSLTGLKTTQIE